jgi:hypothetical protein
VHRRLEAAGQRLAELVAGHQQALAMRGAGVVEVVLLDVGLVCGEAVLALARRRSQYFSTPAFSICLGRCAASLADGGNVVQCCTRAARFAATTP